MLGVAVFNSGVACQKSCLLLGKGYADSILAYGCVVGERGDVNRDEIDIGILILNLGHSGIEEEAGKNNNICALLYCLRDREHSGIVAVFGGLIVLVVDLICLAPRL